MGKIISIPFTGESYKTESKFASPQECINFYVQPYPEMGEKAMALYGTPGLQYWATMATGPIQGMLAYGGVLYVVAGSILYKVSAAGSIVPIGWFGNNSRGPVSMATNGIDIVMTDGIKGKVFNIANQTWLSISDPDFPRCTNVIYTDGYYLVNETGTGRIWRSDWNDGSKWETLSFSTAGANPDNVVSLIVDHKDIWTLGEITCEIWYNSGAATFNFDSIPGAFVEMGATSPHGVTKINNAIYWVGRDQTGVGHIMQSVGRQPKIVSTPPVELSLSNCNLENAIAMSYSQNGHAFVIFTFPDNHLTWVYDPTVGLWHQRSSRINGVDLEWRVGCHVMFNGEHIVGDLYSGKLFKLKTDVYDEDGEPIISVRTSPVVRKDQKLITVDRVQVVTEPGAGLISGGVENTEPQGMFSWSRDGGFHWSADADLPLGKLGMTENRASVYQLGQGRNWVFRLKISARVKKVILGAIAEVELNE